MLHFTNGGVEAQKIKHLTKVCIASYMLEQEFEPRCASTSYTRPIFSKGSFPKIVPLHCLEVISKHVALFYRSPHSVSAAPKQWNQRMVSQVGNLGNGWLNPVKCQRALKSLHKSGEGSFTNTASHRHFSLSRAK